jgi:hypothetical protein
MDVRVHPHASATLLKDELESSVCGPERHGGEERGLTLSRITFLIAISLLPVKRAININKVSIVVRLEKQRILFS